MKRFAVGVMVTLLLIIHCVAIAGEPAKNRHKTLSPAVVKQVTHQTLSPAIIKQVTRPTLHCVAFSPYVGQLNPDYGVQPPKELINELLDKLLTETPFRCIMTYGVLNGLDYIFTAAKQRHFKVIAILWLDKDSNINSQSISRGIALAREFSDTIIRLSCGSEVRIRHDYQYDSEVVRCLDALREAKIKQPITTIDTWWEWCNRQRPCHANSFTEKVDWIGINVFPWWDNEASGFFPCTTAEQAADFHLARLDEVRRTYPHKEVIITEFGWPHAPEGGSLTNSYTQQKCGVASVANQKQVVASTLKKLVASHQSGVVFEAFSEHWKARHEGGFGGSWGICQGKPPYHCIENLMP